MNEQNEMYQVQGLSLYTIHQAFIQCVTRAQDHKTKAGDQTHISSI
jgi:hypothetical protein